MRWSVVILVLVAVGLAAGGWYAFGRGKSGSSKENGKHGEEGKAANITVDVVHPEQGGIKREVTQPGTVEPYEAADLYAKVSGFLVSQDLEREDPTKLGKDGKPTLIKVLGPDGKPIAVDIGTPVQVGDVLARISVPEYVKQVERDQAQVRDADAKVKQMEAHLKAAQAEARAAEASVTLSKVMVRAKTYYRQYREKQLERIKGLAAREAVDAKLVDEQEDYFLSAQEAENAAKENVNTSMEKANAAKAKIDQAAADVDEAKADLGVDQAGLAKSQVLLDYTIIRAPYTGVVTKRNFFPGKEGRPGDFIKAADQGGTVPLLAVERTDLMRVVIQVPDRDVPYLSTKGTAEIEIDALPGVVFGGEKNPLHIARWAKAEDPATRTMRTEVDVPNPDGKLSHGMYGGVTLTLSQGTPKAVRIPSAALVGKAEGGRGSVRVIRDGKVHIAPVRYATDNGIHVEIVSGITAEDQVIVRSSGPVEEGTPVTVNSQRTGAGH